METIGSKSQCFDILQNGIFRYLVGAALLFLPKDRSVQSLCSELLLIKEFLCVCVLDEVGGGSGQHGRRAAESCFQVNRSVHPARRAGSAFPVSVLPQPAGAPRHCAAARPH